MYPAATVLLTGAAGDIGRACAALFLARGDRVVLVDRDAARLAEVEPSAPPDRVLRLTADLRVRAEVAGVVERATANFGPTRYAVLAAGIEGPIGPLESCDEAAFDDVYQVNVKSVWFCLQALLPPMKDAGDGAVAIVASMSGLRGAALLAPYCVSKHAVVGMMRAAALEAGPHGVRVSCVCPGPVESAMMTRIDGSLREAAPERVGAGGDARYGVPMRRYATPTDVAAMIGFLCSEAGRHCSGGTYPVDGGVSAK